MGELEVQKRSFRSYDIQVPVSTTVADLEFHFINDGISQTSGHDRNLQLNWFELDGQRHQFEAPSVTSQGNWTGGCDVAGQYASEWLHCNGFFRF